MPSWAAQLDTPQRGRGSGSPQGRARCPQGEGDTPDLWAAKGLIRDIIKMESSQYTQTPVDSRVGGHIQTSVFGALGQRVAQGAAGRPPGRSPLPHLPRSSTSSLRAGSPADSSFCRRALASVHAARPSPMKAFRVG